MKQQRVDYVDMFRGIGILLMVMGHINFGEKFSHFCGAWYMPMFFFVSGLFYKKTDITLKQFIKKKVKTLLIPYVFFAIIHSIAYWILSDDPPIYGFNFLWINTENLPIAGALWFLTALFIANVIYYIMDTSIKSKVFFNILIAILAILGSVATLILPFRLPWAMDCAFVGIGFYHIARNIKQKKQSLLNISIGRTIMLCIPIIVLIFVNGPCNMREGIYAIIPLFWFNAVAIIILGLNISNFICKTKNKFIQKINSYIINVGINSMTYLCLNQIIIKFFQEICPFVSKANPYIILVFSMCALYLCNLIFINTKLKVLIGKG